MDLIAYLVIFVTLFFILTYVLTAFTGGWYVPAPKSIVLEMLDLAKLSRGDLLVDLGSGDGKIVLESAKRGISALGIEINPFLFLWSKIMARHLKLTNHAHFKLGIFWPEDLSKAKIVTIYLPMTSKKLEKKLKTELKKGSRVLTYRTGFPNWKPNIITKSGIFMYQL